MFIVRILWVSRMVVIQSTVVIEMIAKFRVELLRGFS